MGNRKPNGRGRSRSRSRSRERARSRNRNRERRNRNRAGFLEPRPGAVPAGEINRYRGPAVERRNRINMLRAEPAPGFQLNLPRAQFAPITPAPVGGAAPFQFAPAPFGFGAMGALGVALPSMLERTKTSPNLAAMAAAAGPANNNENENGPPKPAVAAAAPNKNENGNENGNENEWGGNGGIEFRHRKTRKLLHRK